MLLILLSATSLSAETVLAKGQVILDYDGSGQPNADNTGLEGVLVSSLTSITRTDADGRFTLSIDAARDTIFVIKPANTQYPVNQDQLPQFYYHHQPEGSLHTERLRYRGIDPTGPLPDELIFPLLPTEAAENFRVIALTDTQAQSHRELDFLRDSIVAPLVGQEADFVLNTGDIIFDELSLLPRHNRLFGALGKPVFNVAGNHDLDFASPDRANAFETYRRLYGPTYYAFFHGEVCFIALDNLNYFGENQGDYPFRTRGQGAYSGEIDPAQLRWLAQLIEHVPEDKLIVLYSHIPLRTTLNDRASNNTTNLNALLDLLADRSQVYALAGHTHTMEHLWLGPEDGWTGPGTFHHQILSAASGAWFSGPGNPDGLPYAIQADGTPPGYYFIEFSGNKYTPRFFPAAHHTDDQIRIHLDTDFMSQGDWALAHRHPGEIGHSLSAAQLFETLPLYANVFDGCEQTEVHFRVDDRPYQAMTRVFDVDPWMWLYREFSNRGESISTRRDVNPPAKTPHLWKANFPTDLQPGPHSITVRAKSPRGDWEATKVIEVVE
ncbi:MAG: hypothetical protein GVY36_09065 [Verrucomicrobia bacterium]|nr:hypothetical protein [Verrucomicrobiota bacterium]